MRWSRFNSNISSNIKSNDISDDSGWQRVDKIPFKIDRNPQSVESPLLFIFIDGTLSEFYTINSKNFTLILKRGGVGAGFENGTSRRKKILNFAHIQMKNISEGHTNLIKSISDFLSEKFSLENLGEIIYISQEKEQEQVREILARLKDEEIKFAVELAKEISTGKEKIYNQFMVLDGPIPAHKELCESKIRICGLVKNIQYWYDYSEEYFKDLRKGETTDILRIEKNGITKFAFFIKVADENIIAEDSTPVIRAEFTFCEDPVDFANIFKHKILKWSSSIGDRSPKNITPIRVLEKILRNYGGTEEFILKKIHEILKKLDLHIYKNVYT